MDSCEGVILSGRGKQTPKGLRSHSDNWENMLCPGWSKSITMSCESTVKKSDLRGRKPWVPVSTFPYYGISVKWLNSSGPLMTTPWADWVAQAITCLPSLILFKSKHTCKIYLNSLPLSHFPEGTSVWTTTSETSTLSVQKAQFLLCQHSEPHCEQLSKSVMFLNLEGRETHILRSAVALPHFLFPALALLASLPPSTGSRKPSTPNSASFPTKVTPLFAWSIVLPQCADLLFAPQMCQTCSQLWDSVLVLLSAVKSHS